MAVARVADGLRSLRYRPDTHCVVIIDQTRLPGELHWVELRELEDFCHAIEHMQVRGAPLIGITAAFALAFALCQNPGEASCQRSLERLLATRPTAVNLGWALDRVAAVARAALDAGTGECGARVLLEAQRMADEDVAVCRSIGAHGLKILESLYDTVKQGEALQVLTHCNAGWLAALEWGTALAPVYAAAEIGLPVHVWVSETRPRNQGANLTTWELRQAGIPHTLIADNAAGYLLAQNRVDCVLVGSDRTVANGDVCNKIGTYLKALAARESGVPFYVALPVSTIDWTCATGGDIPIEERSAQEVLALHGRDATGRSTTISLAPPGTAACNPAFDVTPGDLVSSLITEYGIFGANPEGLSRLSSAMGIPAES